MTFNGDQKSTIKTSLLRQPKACHNRRPTVAVRKIATNNGGGMTTTKSGRDRHEMRGKKKEEGIAAFRVTTTNLIHVVKERHVAPFIYR